MTTTTALGIDIAKAKFDVALQVGRRHYQATFKNNGDGFGKLQQWLHKSRANRVHACMEATGRYGEALALYLYDQGYKVSVVNPARVKKYADSQLRRNKTDAQDAAIILDFCLTQKPPRWKPPSPQQRKLQELVRYFDTLKKMRRQEQNRLSSGLQVPAVIGQIQQHLAYLEEQLALLEAQIHDHVEQFPELKRDRDLLVSIPGIGKLTAARLLAEIGDIRSFSNAKQLAAYAGLTPSHHESGSSIRKRPRMSKVAATDFVAIYTCRHWLPFATILSLLPFASDCWRAAKQKWSLLVRPCASCCTSSTVSSNPVDLSTPTSPHPPKMPLDN